MFFCFVFVLIGVRPPRFGDCVHNRHVLLSKKAAFGPSGHNCIDYVTLLPNREGEFLRKPFNLPRGVGTRRVPVGGGGGDPHMFQTVEIHLRHLINNIAAFFPSRVYGGVRASRNVLGTVAINEKQQQQQPFSALALDWDRLFGLATTIRKRRAPASERFRYRTRYWHDLHCGYLSFAG
jgi:hypothetical protein